MPWVQAENNRKSIGFFVMARRRLRDIVTWGYHSRGYCTVAWSEWSNSILVLLTSSYCKSVVCSYKKRCKSNLSTKFSLLSNHVFTTNWSFHHYLIYRTPWLQTHCVRLILFGRIKQWIIALTTSLWIGQLYSTELIQTYTASAIIICKQTTLPV